MSIMSIDGDLEQWLDGLPIDTPVDIDGESVYLKIHPAGAELGAYLFHSQSQSYTHAQLQDALQLGFASAVTYDAGLGQTADGKSLVLTQWLPEVRRWSQAAKQLENLLNQIAFWRTRLAPSSTTELASTVDRNERRLRILLAGGKQ